MRAGDGVEIVGGQRVEFRRGKFAAAREGDVFDAIVRCGRHGLAVGQGVVGEDETRREQVEDVAQLAVVARDERIGRRNRRDGYADMHASEGQQQMFERIAREDRDRPFRRQIALQQACGDALHALRKFAIGQLAPGPVGATARNEYRVRRLFRPVQHERGNGARRRRQGVRRARVDQSVPAPVDLDVLRAEFDRPLLAGHGSSGAVARS